MTERAYLDYNATTPLDSAVEAAMRPYWRDCFANPASYHQDGRRARDAVETARAQVAAAVGARAAEVVFTSSGTESNNTIIKGVAKMSIKKAVGVSAIEHPCVLCAARSVRDSMDVAFIAVDQEGRLDRDDLADTLKMDCALISVMTANNETGVIQDIAAITEQVKSAGAWMHTDAAQALGKIPLSFADSGVDAMTLSAHKCYGPKGVAALIVRAGVAWAPLLEGGGHQEGRRSGTENVPGIVGFGEACARAADKLAQQQQIQKMRDEMEASLREAGAVIFSAGAERLPNTCYFGFAGIDGDAMVTMLDQSGFSVTAGAACSSMKDDPSHVLLAMDVPLDTARTAVRASLGADSCADDVRRFTETAVALATQLRGMSALANQD